MPPPSDSTSHGRPQKDDSVPDTLHGIAIHNPYLWHFADYSSSTNHDDGTPVNASTLIDYYFMDGTANQQRAVRSTIEKRLKPPRTKFVTWEDCANVKFRQTLDSNADIRITFRVTNPKLLEDFRSAIGAYAVDDRLYPPSKPSMWLVGLPDKYPPTEFYRGQILHEFGHALGLYHEHQSPTLEGYLGRQLDTAKIIAAFGDKANEVLIKPKNPFNYTRFDKDSIMLYAIKKEWQVHPTLWDRVTSKATGYNSKLSKLDQAFIRLLYPPDLSIPANKKPFLQAMVTAGVPTNAAGRMLDAFLGTEGPLPQRLRAMREQFNTANQQAVKLWNANATILSSIDPIALRRSGVTAFVGEVTKDKLFQTIVKNIVYRTMEQSGIPTDVSVPGSNQTEVKRMLGALAMHDSVGHAVKFYDDQLGRKSDVPKSPKPQDDEDIPRIPETPQFNSRAWIADAGGSGNASVTKSKEERRIIIDAWNTVSSKALLTWKEGSAQFNGHHIDAKGLLYYKDQDLIPAGTKAKWTLGGVAFYHDEWMVDNITAFFSPEIYGYATETDLRSDNELFENVKWEVKHRL